MKDSHEITQNLIEMYGRNDWIMRLNFRFFLSLSGLKNLPRDSRILDCGCAMGHFITMLKAHGFTSVSGLDAAPEMVAAAVRMTGAPVILANALDVENHFERESLDVVIISDLFHHLPSLEAWNRLLVGCNKVLRNGGLLIIREPFPMLLINLLYIMSRRRIFYVGFLKARLNSFVEEDALLQYFFSHWPGRYKDLLAEHGFCIVKDVNWLVHRITSCRKTPDCS
ncbi:MAG: class I SAM-dependent methyltransferase [Thermodesulfovibrionales bacterium]